MTTLASDNPADVHAARRGGRLHLHLPQPRLAEQRRWLREVCGPHGDFRSETDTSGVPYWTVNAAYRVNLMVALLSLGRPVALFDADADTPCCLVRPDYAG